MLFVLVRRRACARVRVYVCGYMCVRVYVCGYMLVYVCVVGCVNTPQCLSMYVHVRA